MRYNTKDRIAVIGVGSNSYTNSNALKTISDAFPDYHCDWFDLVPLVKERTRGCAPALSALNAAYEFAREMGPRLHELKWRRGWTTYLFRLRSAVAREQVSRKQFAFSFQIQSHFDASVPGVPHFVYTDHTSLANRVFPDMASAGVNVSVTPQWLRFERRLYHNARATFVMSRHVYRSLIEDYGCLPERVVCAYGGPNAPVTPPRDKTYKNKEILFVGVHWLRKGGPELVDAFTRVRARLPDARLTIVGSSPHINVPGCEVIGRVAPRELANYYERATLFCMPTRYEPFGIVYLEAMAYKLPIIATDVGAIPDFVLSGENGFRVRPGDVDDLAEKLTLLLSNSDLCRRMGKRSSEIAKLYTWERTGAIFRETIQPYIEDRLLEKT